MRALVYTESYELEVQTVAPPRPAPGEVLIRVEAAGICASDVDGVATRSARRTPPLIMGHELTGTGVEAGDAAGAHLVGARVGVNPQVPCGRCRACSSGQENICGERELIGGTRPGGFAEHVTAPVRCAHPFADDLAADVAVFAEPLATCVHALSLAPGKLPRTAVVLGGGTIGTLAAQLLRADGAGRVIVSEPIAERHELLRGVADAVVRPEELHSSVTELTAGAGADLSIDAVGAASSRPASVEILGAGGCALWLGMHEQEATVPAFQMVVREQRVIGSFAYTNAEFADALGLLLSGHVVPAVASRRVPLDASGDAFRAHLAGSAGGVGKTIVHP